MFDSKKKQLFTPKENKQPTSAKPESVPAFVQAGLKKGAEVLSGNGAKKYRTTGSPLVDQFGKLGEYKKPRSFSDIERDCEALWAIDPLGAVKMSFYIRMISRDINFPGAMAGTVGNRLYKSQRGAELKYEGIMRLIWLATKSDRTFLQNLPLLPIVGSWKDIFTMLQYDLVYHGWSKRVLPWTPIGTLILSALGDTGQRELLKKYLPSIQANSKCKTVEAQADNLIGKWICGLLFPEYKGSEATDEEHAKFQAKYRRLKSSGTAHDWQKLISKRHFDRIDFSKIHGRALSLLVRSKFLKNQGLQEKYTEWVKKPTTETVKFTGFVHELFQDIDNISGRITKYPTLGSMPEYMRETINKQFKELIDKGLGSDVETSSLIVVRDTSGSMTYPATGTNMSSNGIAKALALYFSSFLKGKFANSWIEFNSNAQMHQWMGNTPIERWFNDRTSAIGNTNFQSVITLFCQIKNSGVPESDFPSGILCISDGEFDAASLDQTNVDAARATLKRAGFSKEYVDNCVIVLWNIPNSFYGSRSSTKFETFGGDARNVFYFSGYSASVVAFLTSKIKSAAELVEAALDQEILNLVRI
jgi:hypothetical protein